MPNKFFTSYTPRLKVKCYRPGFTSDFHDFSKDVVSLSTNKAWGRAAGTWQMILVNRIYNTKAYPEFIEPGQVVSIELDAGAGEGFKPVMLGLVDRVSFVRTGGAQPTKQVKISGQDMGKLFAEHDIGWDIKQPLIQIPKQNEDNEISVTPKAFTSLNRLDDISLLTGTAETMMKRLYSLTFTPVVTKMATYFDEPEAKTDDTWLLNDPAVNTLMGQKLWDSIYQRANHPYNMLHCDTRIDNVMKFGMLLLKQPFNNNTGRLEPIWWDTLDDTDIIHDDVGVSDAERINFLFFHPTQYQQMINFATHVVMASPDLIRYDPESIAEHGYKMKEIKTDFLSFATSNTLKTKPDEFEAARKRRDAFWAWHKEMHKLESGSFALHLRPDIRCGHGITVEQAKGKKDKEYLVEQVSHQCNLFPTPSFTTTLGVTRGREQI